MTFTQTSTVAADCVTETRPSPTELNRILHRRFPGYGPAYGAQLDAAARKTFSPDMSKWLGLDGRWHPCGEHYRQPKGKRRTKQAVTPIGVTSQTNQPLRDGWYFSETVACRWREYAPGVAKDALEIVGRVMPATSGIRLVQFGAVEDMMIRRIDAKRALAAHDAANDNVPGSHRRNRPRLRLAA